MGLQSKWIKEVITQAKLNNMTIIGETGTDLAALTGKVKGQVVIAYDTSAGFIQWFMYVWDGSSQWIKVSLPTHKHIDSNSGGSYLDIKLDNEEVIEYSEILSNFGDWKFNSSGTGATSDHHDNGGDVAIRIQTGTTTTGATFAYKGGTIYPDYDSLLQWIWTWQLSNTNNQFFLFGTNIENPNVAQNNSAKIGIEWCDGQPAANYFLTTASGSARSSSDSTVALSTGVDGVKMLFTPGAQANFLFDNGTSINKGTNLPTGGGNGVTSLIMGIKNNNGGASNRTFRSLGLRYIGKREIAQWPI